VAQGRRLAAIPKGRSVKILGYSEDGHALVELTAEEVKVWDAADKAAATVALGK
jgi:hypothetical protein